ncbi:MAG: hypothetical protein ACE366_14290 [Bradymonadia bacterium]
MKKVVRTLTAMAVLSGVQLGATALDVAPNILGISTAQAQVKFTGKIKRIKIKKKRVGSGFKIVSRTSGNDPSAIGSVRTEASAVLDGELIPVEVTPATRRNSIQVAASSPLGTPDLSGPVTLTLQLAEDAFNWDALGGYVPEVSIVLESVGRTATVALGDNGWKVRARLRADGALKAVISNSSSAWNGQGLVGINYQVEGSDLGGELAVDEYRQTWVQDLNGDEALLDQAGAVSLNTTLLDAEGEQVATRNAQVALEEGATPSIDSIRLRETRRGDMRLTAMTFGQDNIAGLDLEVTDQETGEVALSAFDEAPASTFNAYSQTAEFDPGDSPAGSVYLVLLEGVDAEGNPNTEQYEIELPIFGAECTLDSCPAEASVPFADGRGRAVVYQNGETFELWVATTGELNDAPAFNVIFEEPFEGPPPLETEVNLDFEGQANKWVTRGGTGLPSAYTFEALAVDGEGQVVEGVQGSGSGSGTVYKASGNGKGTRKASTIHLQTQIPLL